MRTNRLIPALAWFCAAAVHGATAADTRIIAPTVVARISGGDYCYEHNRRIEVDKQPPSWLALQLKVQVAYHNPGTRPLIIPLEHARVIYTAIHEGNMTTYKELPNVEALNPSLKPMNALPGKVSPDNPTDPKNDYFAVIPPGGDLVSPIVENLLFPINHKVLFRHDPDLRGRKLYVRLQLNQQDVLPSLLTDLSDRWNKFGVPWTGSVMTNVMTVNVPQNPSPSGRCNDGPFETPGNKPPDPGK